LRGPATDSDKNLRRKSIQAQEAICVRPARSGHDPKTPIAGTTSVLRAAPRRSHNALIGAAGVRIELQPRANKSAGTPRGYQLGFAFFRP
jgi:hypothetical protein